MSSKIGSIFKKLYISLQVLILIIGIIVAGVQIYAIINDWIVADNATECIKTETSKKKDLDPGYEFFLYQKYLKYLVKNASADQLREYVKKEEAKCGEFISIYVSDYDRSNSYANVYLKSMFFNTEPYSLTKRLKYLFGTIGILVLLLLILHGLSSWISWLGKTTEKDLESK